MSRMMLLIILAAKLQVQAFWRYLFLVMNVLNGDDDCAWRIKEFAQSCMQIAASIISCERVRKKWTDYHIKTWLGIISVSKITS